MAYRIRYGVKRKYHLWWPVAAGLLAAALTRELWYWDLARYVGRMIDGAR